MGKWTGPEGEGGGEMREKGGRKGARKRTRKTLILVPLWFRYSLVALQLMGLFRGAVFRHGWGALNQPIKQPIETPTSTLALMGRFPLLMGRFLTLVGRFTDFVLRGRFPSWKSTGKQAIKKGQKRYPKELLRQRFRRTFGWTFWCGLPQNPCFNE